MSKILDSGKLSMKPKAGTKRGALEKSRYAFGGSPKSKTARKPRAGNISRTWANKSLSKSRVLARSLHTNNRTLAKKLNAVMIELSNLEEINHTLRDENDHLRQGTRFKDLVVEDLNTMIGEMAQILVNAGKRAQDALSWSHIGTHGDTFSLEGSEDRPEVSASPEGPEEPQNPFQRRDRIPRTPVKGCEERPLPGHELKSTRPKEEAEFLSPIDPHPPMSPVDASEPEPVPALKSLPETASAQEPEPASDLEPVLEPAPAQEPEPASEPPPAQEPEPASEPAPAAPVSPIARAQKAKPANKKKKAQAKPPSPPAPVKKKGDPALAVYDFSMSDTMNQTNLPVPSLADLRAQSDGSKVAPAPKKTTKAQPERSESSEAAPAPKKTTKAQPERSESSEAAPAPKKTKAQSERSESSETAPAPPKETKPQPDRSESSETAPASPKETKAQPDRSESSETAPASKTKPQPNRVESSNAAPAPKNMKLSKSRKKRSDHSSETENAPVGPPLDPHIAAQEAEAGHSVKKEPKSKKRAGNKKTEEDSYAPRPKLLKRDEDSEDFQEFLPKEGKRMAKRTKKEEKEKKTKEEKDKKMKKEEKETKAKTKEEHIPKTEDEKENPMNAIGRAVRITGPQGILSKGSSKRFKRLVSFDDSDDSIIVPGSARKKVREEAIMETPVQKSDQKAPLAEANAQAPPSSSTRLRRTKAINFREPSTRGKLRRGDPDWCRENS